MTYSAIPRHVGGETFEQTGVELRHPGGKRFHALLRFRNARDGEFSAEQLVWVPGRIHFFYPLMGEMCRRDDRRRPSWNNSAPVRQVPEVGAIITDPDYQMHGVVRSETINGRVRCGRIERRLSALRPRTASLMRIRSRTPFVIRHHELSPVHSALRSAHGSASEDRPPGAH
jgi:hypothetical protein